MTNKEAKEFVANLPDADKADLIAALFNGADVDAKVQVIDVDNTVTIPLERYDELIMKETMLDIMVQAKVIDKSSYLPAEIIGLLIKSAQE